MGDFYEELEKYEKQIEETIQHKLNIYFESLSFIIENNNNNNNLLSYLNNIELNTNSQLPLTSKEIFHDIISSNNIRRIIQYKLSNYKKHKYTIDAINNGHSRNKVNSCFGQSKLNTTINIINNIPQRSMNDIINIHNTCIHNNKDNITYNNMFYSTQSETEIIRDIVVKEMCSKIKELLKTENVFTKPTTTENAGTRKVKALKIINNNNNKTHNNSHNIKQIKLKDKQQEQFQYDNNDIYWRITNYQLKPNKKIVFNQNHLPSAKIRNNFIQEQQNFSNLNLTPLTKQQEQYRDNINNNNNDRFNYGKGVKIKINNVNIKHKIVSNKMTHKNLSPIFKMPKNKKRILSSRMRIKGVNVK